MKKVFSKGKRESINPKLKELKEVQGEIDRLQETASDMITEIRKSFVDVVVMFIDIVESTEYKTQHSDEPEKWILMLQQFGELMTEYVQELAGKVVKYIGDEVMAVFDRETCVNDALNLVLRIEEIEANLKTVTKEAIRIKISVDKGKVYMLHYEGHEELDPQGTPVDRCARIAKYAEAGTVLSTFEFIQHSAGKVTWEKIGEPDLKGIGPTSVFQFGAATMEINDLITMEKSKLDALKSESNRMGTHIEELTIENKQLVAKNQNLQNQLESIGETPDPESVFIEKGKTTGEEHWNYITEQIEALTGVIAESPADQNEYARFLFLFMSGGGEEYSTFGKQFDSCIENELVELESGSENFYVLNTSHRRNKQAIALMRSMQSGLDTYERQYRPADDGDLFDYSLSNAEFWKNYVGFNV